MLLIENGAEPPRGNLTHTLLVMTGLRQQLAGFGWR